MPTDAGQPELDAGTLRAMLDTVSEALLVIDADGTILFTNVPAEALIAPGPGRNLIDLIHVNDRSRIRGAIGDARERPDPASPLTHRLLRRDGGRHAEYEGEGYESPNDPRGETRAHYHVPLCCG